MVLETALMLILELRTPTNQYTAMLGERSLTYNIDYLDYTGDDMNLMNLYRNRKVVNKIVSNGYALSKNKKIIHKLLRYMDSKNLLIEHQAYILATITHETARTFSLAEEIKGYDKPYTPFHGRGLIQLSLKTNYERMSKRYNIDLLNNRDLLLTDVDLNVKIAVDGMALGLFTGKSLSDYTVISLDTNTVIFDAVSARAIVNGSDKALKIAELYKTILKILKGI